MNNFAVTNDDLVESLKRSSSALAMANTSLEETIALETSAIEINRDAASTGKLCAWIYGDIY